MATVAVYPRLNTTYDDAAGVPITSAGAIVDVSKYILDALKRGCLLTQDPLDANEPDDRTGITAPVGATFQTRAALQAAAIDVSIDTIELFGHTTAGDGGGGIARRITADFPPVGLGGDELGVITAGDSSKWVYVPDSRGVNVRFFGALGESTTSALNRRGIQNALDFDMYYAFTGSTYVPDGRYEVDDTIHLGYGATVGGALHSTILEGGSRKYLDASFFGGTLIVATMTDRPCIAVSGARGTCIRDISILGPNFDWAYSRNLGTSVTPYDAADVSDWMDPTLSANANSRYAPLAGIAIDPYHGVSVPSPAYPDVAFPPFMSGTTQYNKTPSSDVKLDRVGIAGFVVGLAIQPCDGDAQGDFVSMRECLFQVNVYCISVGNTQSRIVNADNTIFIRFHTGLANTTHGRQQGVVGGEFSNCLFEACIQWINLPDATHAGPLRFTNCYGEEVFRIGVYGSNAADNKPVVFDSCRFSFSTQDAARGAPAFVLESAGRTPIAFKSCDFGLYQSVMVFGGSSENYSFEDCNFATPNARTNMYEKLAHNFTAGGIMFTPYYDRKPQRFTGKMATRYNVTTGATSDVRTMSGSMECDRTLTVPAWISSVTPSGTPGKYFRPITPWLPIDKTAVTSSVSGLTLTLSGFSHVPELAGGAPGDVIFDQTSGTVFFVRSLSAGVILAVAQNNLLGSSLVTTYVPGTGTLWAGVSRVYTPSSYIRGTLSSASSTVSAVARPDGFGGALTTYITNGDYVQVDVTGQLESSWPISKSGATISSVTNGSPGSFAVGANPSVSETRDLAFFILQPPANV
jgi:hypothetical protein